MGGEAFAYHEADLKARSELYGRYARQQLQIGALFTAADYVQAQRARSLIASQCTSPRSSHGKATARPLWNSDWKRSS